MNRKIAVAGCLLACAAGLVAGAQEVNAQAPAETEDVPQFGAKPKKGQWDAWDKTKKTTERPCVTWKRLQAMDFGLEEIGRLRTRTSKEIAASTWSVDCCTLDRDMADYDMYKTHLGELGVKHARLMTGWAKTERVRGRYDFAWLDHVVDDMLARGVQPWMCLQYGNPVWGCDFRLGMKISQLISRPDAYAAWLRYVEATVEHFRGRVTLWEIWNEPFRQGKDYAELVSKTAAVVKRVQPDAVLMVSAMDPADQDVCLARWKDEPTLKWIKWWSFHPYWGRPEGNWETQTPDLRKKIKAFNPDFEVIQGESGCSSQLEYAQALHGFEWTEYTQVKWNLRRALCDFAEGTPSSCYSMTDNLRTYMVESFGLLRSNTLKEFIYRRPSYYAMRNVYSLLDGTVKTGGWTRNVPFTVVKPGDLNPPEKGTDAKALCVSRFMFASGHKAIAYWYSSNMPTSSLRLDRIAFRAADVTIADPVALDLVTGRVFELGRGRVTASDGGTAFADMPAWDAPIAVAERTDLVLVNRAAGELLKEGRNGR